MPSGSFKFTAPKQRSRVSVSKNNLFPWIGYIFFFLMLVLPTTYQLERGVLLAVLLFNGLVFVSLRGWRIAAQVRFWAFVTILTSLFFMLFGAFNDAPGALRVGTVYVLWPFLYLFFIGILRYPEQLQPFYYVLLVAVIVSSIMGIMVVAEKMFGINLFMSAIFEMQGANVGLYEGVIEYLLYNMTTVIYGLPFLLAAVLLPEARSPFRGRWRTVAMLALCLSTVVLLVSGRRAFWLIAGLSPVVVWSLMVSGRMKTFKLRRIVVVGLLGFFLLAVSPFFGVDLQMVWQEFLRAFDFSDVSNLSAYLRREQFFALLAGWLDSPFIGSGLGATASGSLRSVEQPWAYELSYMALLFQTGLIGMFVYCSAVVWVLLKSIKVMRVMPESAALILPVLSGVTCFLIVNATNPYLTKFDYLWVLFLPIAVLNAYLLKGHRSISSSSIGMPGRSYVNA